MSSVEERFFAKVRQAGDDPLAACWEWQGSRGRGGYGHFMSSRKLHLAHRWAYERLIGPIPGGLEIDHLCRVRHCVNPWHMEAVTRAVNAGRARHPEKIPAPVREQARAWVTYGFSQSTIGGWLGIHQTSISRIVREGQ